MTGLAAASRTNDRPCCPSRAGRGASRSRANAIESSAPIFDRRTYIAASRCVGSSGHDRPPSRSWQVPARRTSHRRAGALRWIDVATEKAPTDRGLKVTKGEAPSRRLLAGRKTHVARFRRFRQFIGTLRGGKPSVFWCSHHASRPCGYVCPVPSAETSR